MNDTSSENQISHLPKGWALTTIGEIGNTVTGNTPPTSQPENYGNFIPFVKPHELQNKAIIKAKENLSEQGLKKSRLLPQFSVLVSCIGNLGRTAINKIPVAFNQQ